MRVILPILVAASLLAMILTGPANAHHSYAMFDVRDKEVTLRGTVIKFEFINPHSWLHVSVPNENGSGEHWILQMPSPAQLSRAGWNRISLKPGDEVVVTVNPLKDGHAPLADGMKGGGFRSVRMADGRPVPPQDGD